jgi:hypothetical protein
MKQRSEGATVLLGMPEFAVGAQQSSDDVAEVAGRPCRH